MTQTPGRAGCASTAADVRAPGPPLLSLLRLPLSSSTYHVTASAATAVLPWPSLLTMPPTTASGLLSWVQCGHGEDRGLRHSRQHMPLSPHHSGHTSGPQDAVTATSPSSVPHCCCPRPSMPLYSVSPFSTVHPATTTQLSLLPAHPHGCLHHQHRHRHRGPSAPVHLLM